MTRRKVLRAWQLPRCGGGLHFTGATFDACDELATHSVDGTGPRVYACARHIGWQAYIAEVQARAAATSYGPGRTSTAAYTPPQIGKVTVTEDRRAAAYGKTEWWVEETPAGAAPLTLF